MSVAEIIEADAPVRRFKPYLEYKDSGVEWLGEIPAHWEVTPIRSLAKPGYKTFVDGDWIEAPFIRDEGIRLIQTGNVGVGLYREQGFRYIDEETFHSFRCTEIDPGDVLICRLADPVGRACLAPDLGCRMITSVDVCILKVANDINPRYVVYALSGDEYLSWLSGICRGGTRDRVSRSMLGSLRVQKPPVAEQRAIAAFLDRETVRIDALVAKTEALIALLQEKRTAAITRAVTKGLDPNAAMKDSGIEWLGEIPAHWELKPLSQVLSRITYGFTNPMPVADEGGPYMLTAFDIGDGEILFENARRTTEEAFASLLTDKSRPRSGDILVTKDGTLGRAAVAGEEKMCINQSVALLRFDSSKIVIDFIQNALRASPYQDRMIFEAGGTAIKHIYITRLAKMAVALPPVDEQTKIGKFLLTGRTEIDLLQQKIRGAIKRLQELRAALISAAVTGKIDVRGEAA